MKTTLFMIHALLAITIAGALGQAPEQSVYYSNVQYKSEPVSSLYFSRFESPNKNYNSVLLDKFPLAKDILWSTIQDATKAIFTLNGLTTKAFFKTDGTFSYALIQYPVERLPEELLLNVYRTYKKHRITSAKELILYGRSTFYVNLENGHSYKTLKISDNQIDQVKTLRKSPADRDQE